MEYYGDPNKAFLIMLDLFSLVQITASYCSVPTPIIVP